MAVNVPIITTETVLPGTNECVKTAVLHFPNLCLIWNGKLLAYIYGMVNFLQVMQYVLEIDMSFTNDIKVSVILTVKILWAVTLNQYSYIYGDS